jgi:hypothetical protein
VTWWSKLLNLLPRRSMDQKVQEREEQILEAQTKLEEIDRDGEKVARLEARMRQILHENNLAPAIIRALRVR